MRSLVPFLCWLVISPVAFAQPVTVQQPVVQQFSVGTTVSVPDRGTAYLGGVNSARSARSTYGPLRSGTATGLEHQASGMSASVFIHDFAAMDEAILAASRSPGIAIPGTHTNDDAASFTARLRQRRGDGLPTASSSPATKPRVDPSRSEQLALKAEQAGKWSVAKLHWQHAERHGSTLAAKRLREWQSVERPVAVK